MASKRLIYYLIRERSLQTTINANFFEIKDPVKLTLITPCSLLVKVPTRCFLVTRSLKPLIKYSRGKFRWCKR